MPLKSSPRDSFQKALSELEMSLPQMETKLAQAEKRAAEILFGMRADIKAARTSISLLKERIKEFEERPPDELGLLDRTVDANPVWSKDILAESTENSTRSDQLRDAARIVLLIEGGPLKRSRLVQQLKLRGFELNDPKQIDLMRKALDRDPDFVNIRGKGYWLAGENLPAE